MRSKDNRGIKASPESEEFILSFDSDTDDFARGFACGEIWACLSDGVAEVHCITTTDNTEMVMRMADAADYTFHARDLSEDEFKLLGIETDFDAWLVVVLRAKDA
jgi:hypothetical protein